MTESLKQVGDVSIDQAVIVTSRGDTQEITPQVIGIEIYEDIFATFMTGKIMVRDSQELTTLMPLVGEEILRLKVSTPNFPPETNYDAEFYIYKMSDRVKSADREWIYILHFISKEAVADLNTKISKAYSGNVHDIVEDIVKGQDGLATDKPVNLEAAKNRTKFVSNFWRPSKAIQYACENAVNEFDSPSFVFFENKHGFNFITLDAMYTGPVLYEFGDGSNSSRGSISKDYKDIIEIHAPTAFDYMERLQSGMYGSEIVYFDLLTKQYVHTGYVPDWAGGHMNEFPMWTPNVASRPKAVLIFGAQTYNNFEGFADEASNTKILQKRAAELGRSEAYKINITVFGRTDYSAGQKVYIEVPKATQISADKEDWMDKLQSGNYLIAAICHLITRKDYTCVMELVKDSFMVDLNEV